MHILNMISLCVCAEQKDEVYLNLVLDFVPETVYRVARHFNKAKSIIPIIYVKVNILILATNLFLCDFMFFFPNISQEVVFTLNTTMLSLIRHHVVF